MIDLDLISSSLTKFDDLNEFDLWYLNYESDLINFFYKKNATEFESLNFHNFYFDVFLKSKVYQNFHNDRISSDKFIFFLNLISIACEKLALIGNNHILISLIDDLPDSSNKFRLLAINKFSELNDTRTDYFISLPIILEYLDKSITNYEGGSERSILDILIAFFNKAKLAFSKSHLNGHLNLLKEQLCDVDLKDRYPILKNSIIKDLIEDKDPFSLLINDYSRDCLEPSDIIKDLFNQINREYYNHPRINHTNNDLWGFNIKYILDNILVRGRGDYTSGSGEITANDKVLLYCFYNFKKHYFTTYGVFETVINSLNNFFNNETYKPTFIDLGCGPMTSGLALADLINTIHGKPINFSYIGIDISRPMIDRANSFQTLDFFSNDCDFNYYEHWGEIEFRKIYNKGVNNPLIFNASYLFASDSVNPIDLARTVKEFSNQFKNVYFIFQNPNRIDRNTKYVEFKKHIKYSIIMENKEVIKYKSASNVSEEDVYYEILKIVPL